MAANGVLPILQSSCLPLSRASAPVPNHPPDYQSLLQTLQKPLVDRVILTFQPPENSKTRLLNMNRMDWDSYIEPEHLSPLQKFCLARIRGYQKVTRYDNSPHAKLVRWIISGSGGSCPFKLHHHLSCSEYTYVAIAELGAVRGVLAGANRIFLRCTPWNLLGKHNFNDPIFKVRKKQTKAVDDIFDQTDIFTPACLAPTSLESSLNPDQNSPTTLNTAA